MSIRALTDLNYAMWGPSPLEPKVVQKVEWPERDPAFDRYHPIFGEKRPPLYPMPQDPNDPTGRLINIKV